MADASASGKINVADCALALLPTQNAGRLDCGATSGAVET